MTLLLKLVLAPLLVVGSSLAGRRWGDRVAGMLAALPIVAGPILLITSLEHGPHFGARAASSALLGLVSLAVFAVTFAAASRRPPGVAGRGGAVLGGAGLGGACRAGAWRAGGAGRGGAVLGGAGLGGACRGGYVLGGAARGGGGRGGAARGGGGLRGEGWLAALGVGWGATIVVDVVLAQWTVGPWWGLVIVLAVVVPAGWLVRRMDDDADEAAKVVLPWWDLPARAVATAGLVLVVTGISAAVGPVVTGILAPFPVATSVIAAFVLARQGSGATIRTLVGLVRGLPAFAAFCFLLAVLLGPWGVAAAFTAAAAGGLVVQAAILRRSGP